jgi:hypothetical protein
MTSATEKLGEILSQDAQGRVLVTVDFDNRRGCSGPSDPGRRRSIRGDNKPTNAAGRWLSLRYAKLVQPVFLEQVVQSFYNEMNS